MKKPLKEVMQKKDWVLLAALVVAIVALVLLISPKEETIDTVTVIPPPAQLEPLPAAEAAPQPATVAASASFDYSTIPVEQWAMVGMQDPVSVAPVAAMAITDPVYMPDANLMKAINDKLGRAANTPITVADLEAYPLACPDTTTKIGGSVAVVLELDGKGITSLAGLEKLKAPANRKLVINLAGNNISDLTPLADLTSIVYLNINDNRQLTNLAPLVKLVDMEELYFQNCQVSDISVIAGMTKLQALNALNNQVLNSEALRRHYMTSLELANNRMGRLVMEPYNTYASPTTFALPTKFSISGNYINIHDPRDFSVMLRTVAGVTYWPQYKMDMFDANGNVVQYIVEMGSEPVNFRLLRRATSDGLTFPGLPELIPGAQIIPAYPRDASGNEEKHLVDFTFDPLTGNLVATPKAYGLQRVTFYLWGVDASFTRVSVDFKVMMSK